jgi:hypothetical protein
MFSKGIDVPMVVWLASCPIIIVKGEADRKYRTRVLVQKVYSPLHCPIHGYYIIQGMYDVV